MSSSSPSPPGLPSAPRENTRKPPRAAEAPSCWRLLLDLLHASVLSVFERDVVEVLVQPCAPRLTICAERGYAEPGRPGGAAFVPSRPRPGVRRILILVEEARAVRDDQFLQGFGQATA